ncbi:hypothetical protein H9632_18490, partial [Solibacillus sp. Sa1YVA6]|nr:hypothetical protein [Solibacillus merdavium]
VLDLIKRVYINFDEEEFLLLCHKINPHIVLDFKENFINLGELVSYRFMSYPWFQALVDFHESIADENLSINMNKSSYLATTIAHTIQLPDPKDSPFYQKQINAHIDAAISEIAINILENNMIYKELYKVDFIITGNINKPLNDYINKVTVTKEYEKSHILSIKDIHLIDLNECRLKGEDKDE